MEIIDIGKMPRFNAEVMNGTDSVSKGKVFYGKNDWMPDFALETVCCEEHGAMLCFPFSEEGRIWRCPTCNEGAFELT